MQADKLDLNIQEIVTRNFNKQQLYNVEEGVMQCIQRKRNVLKQSKQIKTYHKLLLAFTVLLELSIIIYPGIFATPFNLTQHASIILGIQSVLILCIMLHLDAIYQLIKKAKKSNSYTLI